MPRLVKILFLSEFVLGFLYALSVKGLLPYEDIITPFIHLNREASIPTWFSSMQLMLVAIICFRIAQSYNQESKKVIWCWALLGMGFLVLSADEVAGFHEAIGHASDQLLPGDSRENSAFSRTGIWMIILAPFVLIIFGTLFFQIKQSLSSIPWSFFKVTIGFAIFLGSATLLEAYSNFTDRGQIFVLLEEIGEMLGITIIVWGLIPKLK